MPTPHSRYYSQSHMLNTVVCTWKGSTRYLLEPAKEGAANRFPASSSSLDSRSFFSPHLCFSFLFSFFKKKKLLQGAHLAASSASAAFTRYNFDSAVSHFTIRRLSLASLLGPGADTSHAEPLQSMIMSTVFFNRSVPPRLQHLPGTQKKQKN